jgi:hypothetical protein
MNIIIRFHIGSVYTNNNKNKVISSSTENTHLAIHSRLVTAKTPPHELTPILQIQSGQGGGRLGIVSRLSGHESTDASALETGRTVREGG